MSSLSISSTNNSSATSPIKDSSSASNSSTVSTRPTSQNPPIKSGAKPPATEEAIEKVLIIVSKMIELVASLINVLKKSDGTVGQPSKSPTTPTPSSTLPTKGDFLWKPISDKDGKLAVLLPKGISGDVKGVKIIASNSSKVLEKGTFSGIGNGEREHYRFSKPGSSFPDGSRVVITMKNGSTKTVTIKETSARFEK